MQLHLKKKSVSLPLPVETGRALITPTPAELDGDLPSIKGDTVVEAPLPHERDESSGMTDCIPSEPVRQAYHDLARGLQDTDRGPVADRAYKKLK